MRTINIEWSFELHQTDILECGRIAMRLALREGLDDTLSRELGVASSSSESAENRPISRGLDGPRIRTPENSIDTLDISIISSDHAITVESLNAI